MTHVTLLQVINFTQGSRTLPFLVPFLLASFLCPFLHPVTRSPQAANKDHHQMQLHPSNPSAEVDERLNTTSTRSNEPEMEVGCEHRPKSPYRTQHPPPTPVRQNCFWASRIQEMSIYHCSPWDFYMPFLTLDEEIMLVLCNYNTVDRVIRVYRYSTSTFPRNTIFKSSIGILLTTMKPTFSKVDYLPSART